MFESVKLVKEHLTSKHGICRKSHFGKERVHQCHACKFMFENEEKKNSHYCRYTLNENPEWGKNYCKICDLKFPSRDQLLQHHRSYHVTEEKHKCDQCDFKVILNTVSAPIKDAASIQKIFFGPMHHGALDQNSSMRI